MKKRYFFAAISTLLLLAFSNKFSYKTNEKEQHQSIEIKEYPGEVELMGILAELYAMNEEAEKATGRCVTA